MCHDHMVCLARCHGVLFLAFQSCSSNLVALCCVVLETMRAHLCAAEVPVAVRLVESCPTCQLQAASQPADSRSACCAVAVFTNYEAFDQEWCICCVFVLFRFPAAMHIDANLRHLKRCCTWDFFERPDRSITPLATAHEHGRSLCSWKNIACK